MSIEKAIESYKNGDYSKAKYYAEKAFKDAYTDYQEANALDWLGDVLCKLEEWSEAISTYKRVTEQQDRLEAFSRTRKAIIYTDLSWAYYNSGEYQAAVDTAEKAFIAAERDSYEEASALDSWGDALFKLKQYDEAEKKYNNAKDRQYERKHPSLVFRVVDALILYRDPYRHENERAAKFDKLNDKINEKLETLSKTRQYEMSFQQTKSLFEAGNLKEAKIYALKAAEIFPNTAAQIDALDWLGVILCRLNEWDQAILAFEKITKEPKRLEQCSKEDTARIYYNLSIAYSNINKFQEAADMAQKGFEIAPDNSFQRAKALWCWGDALRGLNKPNEAAKKYKTILDDYQFKPLAKPNGLTQAAHDQKEKARETELKNLRAVVEKCYQPLVVPVLPRQPAATNYEVLREASQNREQNQNQNTNGIQQPVNNNDPDEVGYFPDFIFRWVRNTMG